MHWIVQLRLNRSICIYERSIHSSCLFLPRSSDGIHFGVEQLFFNTQGFGMSQVGGGMHSRSDINAVR